MAITVTFDPPLPSDSPSVFNTKAFTLLGDLNDWSTEANSLASTVSSNASTSTTNASNASTSADAAATSASNAAASYDSFDDRYLGSKSSAPTLDNDGAALLTGALYWDSVLSAMFVRTSGGAWTALNASTGIAQAITVNSSSAALTVTQTGAGNAFVVEDSASADSTPFVIDSAGNVGIGGAAGGDTSVQLSSNITGATSAYGFRNLQTVQSDVTTNAFAYISSPGTAAASFTLNSLHHFNATPNTFGASSAVTSQYGFTASSSLTGATNNYGFYGNIASGTGRYNFYAAGTAANYFGGNVTVGGGGTLGYGAGSGGTVTQASTRTTGVTLNKPSGDVTLVSAAGSATYQSLTVTNSAVEATDSISCSQKSGTDLYEIHTTNVAAGSFRITYRTTGGTTTEQPVFHFNVIKGSAT